MTDDENRRLKDELRATRNSVNDLADAVDRMAKSQQRGRVYSALLAAVVVGLGFLSIYTGFYVNSTNDQLRSLSERQFLLTCQSTNEAREALRSDNLSDTEALILVTNADTEAPEVAQEYREITRRNNEAIKNRDCAGELQSLDEEGAIP